MTMNIDTERDALIVVDVQNDFCPGGALAVPEGDLVVAPLNRMLDGSWKITIATRDWHPDNHISFKSRGGIWPAHCIAGTDGAAFHAALRTDKVNLIVSKADRPDLEAYSGFEGTGLSGKLKKVGSERLFIGGLATDYCVKNTVIDGLTNGFEVYVFEDAVRGVNVEPEDSAYALREMQDKGAKLIRTTDLTFG